MDFCEQRLQVTIWFDYCGHFTNKVYVFSSVGELPSPSDSAETLNFNTESNESNLNAQNYFAFLKFSDEFEISEPKFCVDNEEGISVCFMLSNLQRSKVFFF